jgi:hypothetical protein
MTTLVRAGILAGTLMTAGCGLGDGECLVESRALELSGQTADGPVIVNGFLELSETRGSENGAFVIWHFRVVPSSGNVTAVLLRRGTPGAPGRELYRFPLVNGVPASGVITQVFARTPYDGVMPFPDFWDLVQREPVSFFAEVDGGARLLSVGPLVRTGSSDWQEACS